MQDDTVCLKSKAPDIPFGGLAVPVHRASTVTFETVSDYQARRAAMYDGYSYGLYGTPTSRALEDSVAALEGAYRSIVVPSGFSAIVLATMANVVSGQRVLFPDNAYDTVRPFAERFLSGLGIRTTFYDPMIGAEIGALIGADVGLVWVESPGSMTLEVQDLPAIAKACAAAGVKLAADNTYATPLRCKPLSLGVDMAVTALSKYVAGHSDVVMGSIAVNDEALFRRLKDYARFMGLGVSADEASLALRGMETVAVRLDRCEASALTIARRLAEHPAVAEVRHPALVSNPGHRFWQRDFTGSTGLITLFMREWTRPRLAEAIETMSLFAIGASWGGTKSVVAVLDRAPLRTATPSPHQGPVVRLSIGMENPDDLLSSILGGLARLEGAERDLADAVELGSREGVGQ
jgi:cystathionine beta-lyase